MLQRRRQVVFLLKVKNNKIPDFHLVLIEWVKATTDSTSASSFYINNNKRFWWSEKLGVLLSCLVSINDSFMAMKYVSLAHGCTICGYSVSLRCSQRPRLQSHKVGLPKLKLAIWYLLNPGYYGNANIWSIFISFHEQVSTSKLKKEYVKRSKLLMNQKWKKKDCFML